MLPILLLILALLPGCWRKRALATFHSTAVTAPSEQRSPSASGASSKGKMILNVEGTNLDFILHAFTIQDQSFELTGQGVKLVGSLPPSWDGNWKKLAGQTISILPRDSVFGNSELDLPGTGIAPVNSGRIIIENVMGGRLRGQISFVVQGPFGERTFAGTCDVGIAKK